ncbi:RNaseP-like protein with Nifu domain, putative [Theileria annulata]|uniref:RNaseP-like protein with Nifu domain, putative n=1 Tax=Theileria annulata TaxID=5874 RepID=Q4UGE0_THEAN|nr:RNaseP-like protein with Nifu domain, putative [Theileria annulata]CAI73849.1 RNaseP-like protein with Nifu domain, putative [Theileria annulata]|eukprot:XP_954526.1 RNaseP-like protein with Nifu domain, putative [Theileria annulata]
MVRVKNRWIIFKVELSDHNKLNSLDRILKPSVIKPEIDKSAEFLFGLLQGNFISNNITVPFANSTESLALLQCRKAFLKETLLIVKFIKKIQNIDISFVPVRVSGTLHQARKFILSKILESLEQISILELSGTQVPEKSSLLLGINRINLVRRYSPEVNDHFNNPRNVGSFDKDDPSVGTAIVGKAACGDVIKLQVKIKDEVIEDACFKTFGCGSAIASSSYVTEMVKGKTCKEALAIKNTDISGTFLLYSYITNYLQGDT